MPTLLNAKEPFHNADIARMLERLLKLAVPTMILWLLMFYGLFHVWLNIVAEITYFGDRLFYKSWWNATRLDVYWRYGCGCLVVFSPSRLWVECCVTYELCVVVGLF